MFIKHKDISKCLENIFQYKNKKDKYEQFFQEYMKYGYWKEAVKAEKLAYTTMINDNSKNIKLIEEHKRKEKVALFRKKQLEKKEQLFFGDTFNLKLRDSKSCIGINEISVYEGNLICLSCKTSQSIDVLFKLKEFSCIECVSCKKLFIPVPRYYKSYNVCSNIPAEWILSDEDKEVFDE